MKQLDDHIAHETSHLIEALTKALYGDCADDMHAALINLDDGTCDYRELIPVLTQIASCRAPFHYYDDNGAGGLPHPDLRQKAYFDSTAAQAIANIEQNAALGNFTEFARGLKTASGRYIEHTLRLLEHQCNCVDAMLIPILEKIERKNTWRSYSYEGGEKVEFVLGTRARALIERIRQEISKEFGSARAPAQHAVESGAAEASADSEPGEETVSCALCEDLGDELSVNTGRDDASPPDWYPLSRLDGSIFYCPGCGTCFEWTDMSSWTGSGNNDEERMTRLSPARSRQLRKKA
jgi:hypothetical protein